MKEKKSEEVSETKVIKSESKIITKDRILSFAIGVFIGALITSGVMCMCMKAHNPRSFDNEKVHMIDRQGPGTRRKHNKAEDNQDKSAEENKTDKSTEDTQDNNKTTY